MKQPNYIVLQCYGHEGIFYECTYALLSLSRLYTAEALANTEIWLYTDKPEWFEGLKGCTLPLHYRKIDNQLLQKWRGQTDFVHRVKIEALRDFAQNHDGNILYLDTDVVLLHRLDEVFANIAAGKLYMHVMEGIVQDGGNAILKKLWNFLKQHRSMDINGTSINIPDDAAMWNAGVLGFNTQHKQLLDEVLAFTDVVHPMFPKHVVEQFAFSLYFQQQDAVKAAAPYILHYWNLKEARQILASFFNYFKDKTWDELVHYSKLVQIHVPMQDKVSFLHNRSILDKLKKTTWQPAIPNWALLMQQL